MLIRYEVANFRSILAPVELSMVAIDSDRDAVRAVDPLGQSLVTTAAIYGPNASGKSNVLTSLAWLIEAVATSLRAWDEEIPVEPFALGAGGLKNTQFVLELAVRGVRHEYVLELNAERVEYEALFSYPEKRRRRLFEREDQVLTLQRGLGALSGTRELLTEQSLALSIARRFDEPNVSGFVREVLLSQTVGLEPRRRRGFPAGARMGRGARATRRIFENPRRQGVLFDSDEEGSRLGAVDLEERERALALLRLADLGIEDVQITEERVAYPDESDGRIVQRLSLLHRGLDGRLEPLAFVDESDGTRTWFGIIGPILNALKHGSVLVVDELDASLHPTLSAAVLDLFQHPATNPRGAQLVFTSHDTTLLRHLNRDEVWLTEKLPGGSTRMGPLSDFAGERVRRSRDLENAYLSGRFGALPELDDVELLRALGLIG